MARATALGASLGLLLVAPSAVAERFELVDAQGRSIEVEVGSVNETEVEFRKDGKEMGLLLERLDPDNRAALVAMAKEKGLFNRYPPLDIQVTVRDKDRRQSNSSYMRNLWLTPVMTLEGEERLREIPELEATIQVICADTKALYAERKKRYQIRVRNKLEVPAAVEGDRRTFEFKTFKLQFDEDRDRSNTGGWIYRYWICALRDPESGAVIHYETNYDALQKHLEEFPGERDKYLALGVGKTMPTKFRDPALRDPASSAGRPIPVPR